MIYLDNAATTYPKPDLVYKGVEFALKNYSFNAGRGDYIESKNEIKMLGSARESIASLVSKDANNVVFTSGATESLNIIINGLDLQSHDNVYISPFEHNSIIRPLYLLKQKINFEINIIPFDNKSWIVDVDKLNQMFQFKKPKALFVSQISNVVGLMIDHKIIFQISKKYNCINVLDSSQGFGEINPDLSHCDFCVFAGHKSLYSIFGVGGFIANSSFKLSLTKSGGTGSDSLNQYMPESGYARYEAGSYNTIAIYSLLKSVEYLKQNDNFKQIKFLTDYLIQKLGLLKNVVLFLPQGPSKVFSIVSFAVKGYESSSVADILSNEFDIKVRSGFHCSPFVHDFIKSKEYGGTVRASLGIFNTQEDVDELCDALKSL